MLLLTETEIWSKLEDPFGCADYMPKMLEDLQIKPSKELIDEICWECIYHQGTLYTITFATVPYLVNFCEKHANEKLVWDTILCLGIILYDVDDKTLKKTYEDADLEVAVRQQIIGGYNEAMERYAKLVDSYKEYAKTQEESDKRYFLVALGLVEGMYSISELFTNFSCNDEYVFECPECVGECYLENENDNQDLTLYGEDTIFHKDAQPFAIEPREAIENPQYPQDVEPFYNYTFQWLYYYVKMLDIKSLENVSRYLFGQATCPHCKESINLFENK